MNDTERERRIRRLAERRGVAVRKSPEEDPHSPDFGKFQIVDPGDNTVIAGDEPHAYSLTLNDVEQWFTNDEVTPQASVELSPFKTRQASRDAETRIPDKSACDEPRW
jgi:hypothetical protein